eukprot:TRINITY_DN5697_c0_g1_i1.p2 TRINITY_DN5697_c0_g1~~TRINITY_DN5697_c0_g1_i1.p2  ORF type:complete len:71 (+),score=10.48 TRINITY_DN5697_c0_g1_i1:101-313(+)
MGCCSGSARLVLPPQNDSEKLSPYNGLGPWAFTEINARSPIRYAKTGFASKEYALLQQSQQFSKGKREKR